MDQTTREHLNNLHSNDADSRYASFQYIINLTNQPVDWAHEVWDDLLNLLRTGDNHQRTIAIQVLSNLAESDTEKRLLKDLDQLLVVTKDEKFVTARHSLQSLWKVAVVSDDLKKKVVDNLKVTALALIQKEDNVKYRKKYTGLWKDLLKETEKQSR